MQTRYALQQTTPPSIEPITVEEAKAQMRVTISDDDSYIGSLIKAARAKLENETGRVFVSQKWLMVMDSFPGTDSSPFPYDQWPSYQIPPYFTLPIIPDLKDPRAIILPIGPVTAIDSIKTVDANGTESAAFAASNYVTDFVSFPARIRLKTSAAWPIPSAGLASANGVRVAFTVGSAVVAGACTAPEDFVHAVKLLVAHYYENRENVTTLSLAKIPMGVESLIAPYRMWQRET